MTAVKFVIVMLVVNIAATIFNVLTGNYLLAAFNASAACALALVLAQRIRLEDEAARVQSEIDVTTEQIKAVIASRIRESGR